MTDWKFGLKADPTPWLLEKDNPSVRYLVLTEILDRPDKDPEVRRVKDELMTKQMGNCECPEGFKKVFLSLMSWGIGR